MHVTRRELLKLGGAAVALGYVANPEGSADAAYVQSGRYAIDVAGVRVEARASLRAPYDPDGARARA